ncbi:vWA domain-containing protein [Cryobacterium aureum]|uniref:vWA domain-containing protein n=1 Tax=Cryobacterium aureum TaxID=995037 RepID=UPI000CF56093|nr:vWA domain-containing protein [Cryobacterium aureum]
MQWTKKNFDAVGLTQYPVGREFAALQDQFGGSVILCLDVSGSMSGARLPQAVSGCHRFVAEAVAAGYDVAGLLWHLGVAGHTELSRDPRAADALFSTAFASGGNNIVPALHQCESQFEGRTGDRVIAIFGDGDLGDAGTAVREARRLADKGIRVLTCGLGDASAAELGSISTEPVAARVARSDGIADAIAGMADGLRRG